MARVKCVKSKYEECDDANIVTSSILQISGTSPADDQVMSLSAISTSIIKTISVVNINGGWGINTTNNNFTVPETGIYQISYSTSYLITALGGGALGVVMTIDFLIDGVILAEGTITNSNDSLDRINYASKSIVANLRFGQIISIIISGFSTSLGTPTGTATVLTGLGSTTHLMVYRIN